MSDRDGAEAGPMADAAHHESVTDQPESKEADWIDDQIHRHGIDRVARAREASLQHREADLHEHDQKPTDQHPGEVERLYIHHRINEPPHDWACRALRAPPDNGWPAI